MHPTKLYYLVPRETLFLLFLALFACTLQYICYKENNRNDNNKPTEERAMKAGEVRKMAQEKGIKVSFGYIDTKRGSEGRWFLNDKPYTLKQAGKLLKK